MRSLMVIAGAGAMVACSGGGSGSSSSPGGGYGSAVSAQFIDAPVKGLAFSSPSNANGITGDQGKFSCKLGEVVNFSLKGFKLGQAACGETIFVHDLFAPVGVSNHKWEQAAAVIQSFATGSTVLDLSAVNATGTDLSSLNYNANNATFDTAVQTQVTTAAIAGTTHLTTANAQTAANQSLSDLTSISDDLKSDLDNLIQHESGEFILKAELSSGTTDQGQELCDKYLDALMKVEKSTVNTKDIYTLKPLRAISYLALSEANADVTCVNQPNNCFSVSGAMLPNKKIITGSNFAVAAAADVDNYRGITDLNVNSNTILSMVTTGAGVNLKVGGTIYNELTVRGVPQTGNQPPIGFKVKCHFNIK